MHTTFPLRLKKAAALLFISVISYSGAVAQEAQITPAKNEYGTFPKIYFNLTSGINNVGGVLGVGLDIPIAAKASVGVGLGISTWGTKFYGEGRYYFNDYKTGWALGAGITHNSGLKDFDIEMETVYGDDEKVGLELKPSTNLFGSVYRFWHLGKKNNRFHLQLGYSFALSEKGEYIQQYGTPISKTSRDAIRLLGPGGLIIGVGFSFQLGGN